MVKKSKGWDFNEMQESLVKDTEQRIEQGFEAIKNGDGGAVTQQQTKQDAVVRTARMFHKERTQDVLVHCPESLHRRLRERKDHIWDEYGERVTINNMVIEAIALWLDQQENEKVSATT